MVYVCNMNAPAKSHRTHNSVRLKDSKLSQQRTHTHTHAFVRRTFVAVDIQLTLILTPGVFFLNLIFLVTLNDTEITFLYFYPDNAARRLTNVATHAANTHDRCVVVADVGSFVAVFRMPSWIFLRFEMRWPHSNDKTK